MLLGQDRADECETFLENVRIGCFEAAVTDFAVDSIAIVMESRGKKPVEIRLFLSSLLGYKSLQSYSLTLYDRIEATEHMDRFNVDFGDSTTYQAMKSLGVTEIVSFDKDFDKIHDLKRLEPREVSPDRLGPREKMG